MKTTTKLTTRDDFDPGYVLNLLRLPLDSEDSKRMLEEACHRIVRLEEQLKDTLYCAQQIMKGLDRWNN